MVLGSHANTRALYSTPPWPSLAASMAAYRLRSFSDNHPKKRCIFSSISAEYTSMLDSLSQNLCCRKDTTAQVCREVILDHILSFDLQLLCNPKDRPDVLARRLRDQHLATYGIGLDAGCEVDMRPHDPILGALMRAEIPYHHFAGVYPNAHFHFG